ncbi:MAG TPA: hypothetical protein VNT56_03310 [Acidimicrobiales bacterium]|nr:hypothetical protein [Acidimicrobiales bacterium]
MDLGAVLAGPILRRCDAERICVWLATSSEHPVRVTVFAGDTPGDPVPLGAAEAARVRLGPRLVVQLASVRPDAGRFPLDTLLAYDVEVGAGGDTRNLAGLGLLDDSPGLSYGDHRLPTFFLRGPATPSLHLLHGSCRLLHGKGEDAFLAADETLAATAGDLARRPAALLLTGDQIYADEVGGPLIGHLGRLGSALLGPGDDSSVPGLPPLSTIATYGRQGLAEDRAGFTSDKAQNHLFSQGEFAAAYLVAWQEANWPPAWPDAEEVLDRHRDTPRQQRRLRSQFEHEASCLDAARRALPAVRRVLANVPTYACFDDHDVTDDWNLSREWCQQVHSSPTGRRAVANALAAFWAFQAWGNDPDAFDDAFLAAVAAGFADDGEARRHLDGVVWGFDRWSYRIPTDPPVVMLDTRTQRSFDSDRGAARLVSDAEARRLVGLCAGRDEASGPLVMVSAVPVFGLELQERRQKFLVGKLGPYAIDFEAWHSNLAGFVDFMHLLVGELGLRRCVMVSGDVHYGLNVDARFSIDDAELRVAQVVSSSFKHSGALEKSALHALGRVVRGGPDRVGWDRPPDTSGATGVIDRLLTRAVNTDEWNDDSPVFVPHQLLGHLGATPPPRYHETRSYIDPEEHPGWAIVGDNNVGYLSVGPDEVVHRLLTRNGSGSGTYTARFRLEP